MKTIGLFLILITLFQGEPALASSPDTGYLFAYGTESNAGRNGLHFAWSIDNENWYPIGPEHSFERSHYGGHGSGKRMLSPYLFRGPDDLWHLVWGLNEQDGTFAHAASENLINWKRQSYPVMSTDKNLVKPELSYDQSGGQFTVTWMSEEAAGNRYYQTTTGDFKEYSSPANISATNRLNNRQTVMIRGESLEGTIHDVPWNLIQSLIEAHQLSVFRRQQNSESTAQDPERFARLRPLEASITIDASKSKEISDMLMGIFFEDINYAADGGIYAELVQNRGFEYHPGDRGNRDQNWNSYYAWSLNGNNATFTVDTVQPLHINNKHYAVLNVSRVGTGLVNSGWEGIPVEAGEKYNFSVFARAMDNNGGPLTIRLIGQNNEVLGEAQTENISSEWQKYKVDLTANRTVADARLEVIPRSTGRTALDMISLFPENTFMGRENGLRADLAQVLADLNPQYVRFPGGCVSHGDGLHNMYRWKNTIGPLEERIPQRNIWNYHQSMGLGYYEYFLFCEDIGAEPIPIVPAGVPCQNSTTGGPGQQGGIPMCEMDDYVQEVLDLIEWANGDVNTTWGRKRAEAGHPEPFNLKYIGVGNEDLITDIFEDRFKMIYDAVKEQHPEIVVIGNVGPSYEGSDYDEGWDLANRLDLEIVDEHYYASPGWFFNNQNFYDKYDRSKSKVYLGEYAAHVSGRRNNMEAALAEALHLTNLERNADVVIMASYAPLFGKEGFTQWNPNLIYFNNTEVKPTVNYQVQKLFGLNAGDEYLPSTVTLSAGQEDVRKRYSVSVVRDSGTGDLVVKIVNILPVGVESTINFDGLQVNGNNAVKSVLQGDPADTDPVPVTSNLSISGEYTDVVPPYSLTIIRIER